MINRVEAIVLFVQDLAGCTAFYQDTFTLPYKGSDAQSATFGLHEGLYLILLSPEGAAGLLGMEVTALKNQGGSRGLLAVSVADIDGAYADLKAKGVTLVAPQPISRGGCVRRISPIQRATSGRSTSP